MITNDQLKVTYVKGIVFCSNAKFNKYIPCELCLKNKELYSKINLPANRFLDFKRPTIVDNNCLSIRIK